MPTVTSYRNGATLGVGGGNPNPPKRDRVKGWSTGAVRRHTAWLYSIDAPALDANGYAFTLTMRDTPSTSDEWVATRIAWEKRVRRLPGFLRLHWVVEWQRRGTPHLHCAIYFATPVAPEPARVVFAWVAVAERFGARFQGQHFDDITGPLGWLQYLSKHAARGVKHYQRQGKPSGWESTGRLWGHSSGWPAEEPMRFDLDMPTYHRFRRLVRSWRIADARASGDPRRIALARRMLSCGSPRLSAVRGVSDWVPEGTAAAFVALLAAEGRSVEQVTS